ncbi:hypothetical protein FJTKL_01002 [Diaporthe vaccinii]|uniref:Uncharacterized protein n=1 Tax=Diaporthe vaccinii TaxID=105482 RepID=A0ABR4E1L4_9PEZI
MSFVYSTIVASIVVASITNSYHPISDSIPQRSHSTSCTRTWTGFISFIFGRLSQMLGLYHDAHDLPIPLTLAVFIIKQDNAFSRDSQRFTSHRRCSSDRDTPWIFASIYQ